ncbi:MAG: hypothetical protein ABJB85_09030 [Nitrososphaerota archaeon]
MGEISKCNRTETAGRIEFAFNRGKIRIDELKDPKKTLRIDSKVLAEAESKDEVIESPEENGQKRETKKVIAEDLRKQVDTVGKPGEPGEQIQNVISVGMLSEGCTLNFMPSSLVHWNTIIRLYHQIKISRHFDHP